LCLGVCILLSIPTAVHDRQLKNFILGPAGATSQAVDTPVLVVISAVAFVGETDGLDRAYVIIIIVASI